MIALYEKHKSKGKKDTQAISDVGKDAG